MLLFVRKRFGNCIAGRLGLMRGKADGSAILSHCFN